MPISINQDIDVHNVHNVTVSGTVNTPAGAVTVEMYDQSGTDLGAAIVHPDHTWTFDNYSPTHNPGGNSSGLEAVLHNAAGTFEFSDTLYVDSDFPSPGQVSSEFVTVGSSKSTVYDANGRALYDTKLLFPEGNPTTAQVHGHGGSGILYSTFSMYHETIDNFRVGGSHHDKLNLADTGLANLAQVLHNTTMGQGSATIHVDPETSVTLHGVTKQQLASHRNDFSFS